MHIHNIFTHPLDISKDGFEMTCNPKSGSCMIMQHSFLNSGESQLFSEIKGGKGFSLADYQATLYWLLGFVHGQKIVSPLPSNASSIIAFVQLTVASCPGEYHSPGRIDSDI